jgi:hypothetical protein
MKLVRLIKICLNKTYSEVCIGKNLSDSFPNQSSVKQGYSISLLPYNFASIFAIMKVHENQGGLELSGTH